MLSLNAHEVKARFAECLDLLEAGETIIVCRRNKPVAELRPLSRPQGPRPIGLGHGQVDMKKGFFEPLGESWLLPE